MSFSFLKSKKFLIVLVICIVILAPSSYAGAAYYQSNKLVKEAAKLEAAGDYAGAVVKYDQAKKKWKWNDKKITPKKTTAIKYQDQAKVLAEGEANFGVGEWQKCLDSLAKIEKDFPKYSQAQNRYSDCQKKLDEETVAAAKAEADKMTAEATAKTAAAAKAKADAAAKAKVTSMTSPATVDPVDSRIYSAIKSYCGSYTTGICGECLTNNSTCKTSTDAIISKVTTYCNDRRYIDLYNENRERVGDASPAYIAEQDALCAEGFADPSQFINQYYGGR